MKSRTTLNMLGFVLVLTLGLLAGAPGRLPRMFATAAAATLAPEATITVNSTADGTPANNGACTLREALMNANGANQSGSTDCVAGGAAGNTITFNLPAGPQTINLMGALPDITRSLTITGPGAKLLTVRRNTGGDYRIFSIPNGGLNIAISKLTINNGLKPVSFSENDEGGGIMSLSALTLTDCAITGNSAALGGGVNLRNANGVFSGCTFSGNSLVSGSGGSGSGIFYSAGSQSKLTLSNCTISDNYGPYGGVGMLAGGVVEVVNCTIANNDRRSSSAAGTGIHAGVGGKVSLRNTIIANNPPPGSPIVATNLGAEPGGQVISLGNNLASDHGGIFNQPTFLNQPTDKINTDPLLHPLTDNGGQTQTRGLQPGSPAINAGNNCVTANNCATNNLGFNLTTDQRGAGFNRLVGNAVDIGAFEFLNTAPTINVVAITRQKGSVTANLQIATALDAQDFENNLNVKVDGGASATKNGVTVSGLVLNADGQVTANIATTCTATSASFTLTVTDTGGLTANATLTVTVSANTAPVFSTYTNQSVTAGGSLTAPPAGFPTDNGTFSLAVQSLGTYTGTISLTSNGYVLISNAKPAGVHTITIRATDNCGAITDATLALTVNCPTITLGPAALPNGTAGTSYSANITASGGGATYAFTTSAGALPNGLSLSSGGVLSGTPNAAGTFNFTVKATDAYGCAGTKAYTVKINGVPTITPASVSRQQGSPAGNLTIANVNDPDQALNTLAVTVNSGASATANGVTISGISVSAAGAVTANVVATCTATSAPFILAVTDSAGASANAALLITVTNNSAPTLSYNNQTVAVGGSLNINPATALSDNGSVSAIVVQSQGTYSGTISVNSSGVVSISGAKPSGVHTITIRATDNCGATTDATFTLTVNCPTISLSPDSLPTGTAGSGYNQSLTASGGTAPYSFSLSAGTLPNGMSLSAAGLLSGTPTAFGTFNFTASVTDAKGCQGTKAYSLVINQPACPTITVNPATLPAGTQGTAYNQTLTASGGTAAYTFAVSAGALPAGLTLDAGGLLAGTPTASGNFSFTAKATDANDCSGERQYSLTINGSCPTITVSPATPLASGTIGTPYSQTFTQAGGTGAITWSNTGTLPAGLALNGSSGVLSGTPTTAGSYTFTIQAQDANNCSGSRQYSIVVSGGGTGLAFYPLPFPLRLLDTRAGFSGCDSPGAPIAGGTSRTQLARRTCNGVTIPAGAMAVTGNVTTVQSGGGYLTLYPSGVAQPLAASSNFNPNEVLNNVFTVGLGEADGAFKIFATSNTDVVVDITGYYAPPAAGGLYFHPLPKPVRLLETRAGFTGCSAPGVALAAGSDTPQLATGGCAGVTIPATAQAIVGNATTVGPQTGGYLTFYPASAERQLAASSNFAAGQVINAPFTVGLSPSGAFNIYTTSQTDLVVDVLGYYSAEASDANGMGLLFNPLPSPVRLLETRTGQAGCNTPNAPLASGSTRDQQARGACGGQTIASTAAAIVGNATVINAQAGYLTFWPDGAAQPLVATTNFSAGQILNRHFTAGLGATGVFNIFASAQTDLIIDVSGYFAPRP